MAKSVDRRILKTQKLLHEALRSLIAEKDYDAITVQNILDRANVGRSTFYMHFRDKDELLTGGIHDMLSTVHQEEAHQASGEPFTWFSGPIFESIDRHRRHPASGAQMGARGRALLHDHLRRVLTGLIAKKVRSNDRRKRKGSPYPPDLLIQHVASTFILVLDWWVESRSTMSPKAVNEMFRALIQPALNAGEVEGPRR